MPTGRIFNSDPLRKKDPQKDDGGGGDLPGGGGEAGNGGGEEAGGQLRVVYAEMLFRCNFVAFVAGASPNQVQVGGGERSRLASSLNLAIVFQIWDDFRKRVVLRLDMDSPVRAVKLRRDRIVVVTDGSVRVYTFTGEPALLHTFATPANERGLCSLSPSSAHSVLAFPGSPTGAPAAGGSAVSVGTVQVVDLADIKRPPLVICAHETK